ncbi:MAG: SCO family protein [Bacteroidota bacterium]
MNINRLVGIVCLLGALMSSIGCDSQPASKYPVDKPLPVFGVSKMVDGLLVQHSIPSFSFVNQDSNQVSEKDFDGKIYIADFFFSTCPDICPMMSAQMVRVYEAFEDNEKVAILSHSLDPEYDTPAVLKDYASKLGVQAPKWNMVTGYSRRFISEFGQSNYLVTAKEDEGAPKGILHSGHFLLVDKDRKIRGLYDGTTEREVNMLIHDIKRLLNEE